MSRRQALGTRGEELAAAFLTRAGLEVVARNYRSRLGEIDLVARDRDELVFVEVKTRSSTAFGEPAEAVSPRKARRLRTLAARWLAERRPPYTTELRFDVVSVLRSRIGAAHVVHLRGAF